MSFNPRTRVGCDNAETFDRDMPIKFQSTHPRGVRLANIGEQDIKTKVSIHAPAWGATWVGNRFTVFILVSIHAPAWGATCLLQIGAR